MVKADKLRDDAAHRLADDVRLIDIVVIQHGNCVISHVLKRVIALTRRQAGRSASIAVVVADHESPAIGKAVAPDLVPVNHRTASAHDE